MLRPVAYRVSILVLMPGGVVHVDVVHQGEWGDAGGEDGLVDDPEQGVHQVAVQDGIICGEQEFDAYARLSSASSRTSTMPS